MDSLTQVVLGAAVAEAAFGKKIGNKAILWGGVAGTIPDLDVIVSPFFDPVTALFVHRGFSHSLLFPFIAAPLVGWLISKIERNATGMNWRQWTLLAFLSIFTHSFIDYFNSYGTGIFEPFSSYRLAFDSIGIIDFFYTIPFLLFTAWLMFYPAGHKMRKVLVWTGIIVSTLYLGYTVTNKLQIEREVKQELAARSIDYDRILSSPLPMTNFLWMVVVQDNTGFYIGYRSVFDGDTPTQYEYVKQNDNLLRRFANDKSVRGVKQFTNGFYVVEVDDDGRLWLHDLRFGGLATGAYVFSFQLKPSLNGVEVTREHPNRRFTPENVRRYWKRIGL
ncbi:MAG: metal-dependent hydrolase [Bacteroidales bacterium]|nr:metal-dependent hydrolase [Bacteroidales bacterium]MBN2749493.1 metal-dependent hydrolase [Bacteroidales bacterium]